MTRFITRIYQEFSRGGVSLISGSAKLAGSIHGTVVATLQSSAHLLGVGLVNKIIRPIQDALGGGLTHSFVTPSETGNLGAGLVGSVTS
jgi:hypothetical protein